MSVLENPKLLQGGIIAARPILEEDILQQWNAARQRLPVLKESKFDPPREDDIKDIEWNAQEAYRRINLKNPIQSIWAILYPNNRSNDCICYAMEKVVHSWDKLVHKDFLDALGKKRLGELNEASTNAMAWHQQARLKFNLHKQHPQLLQQFSLRQWRFFAFTAKALLDLEPILREVIQCKSAQLEAEELGDLLRHAVWHTDALFRLVGTVDTPDLRTRLKAPRKEIIRLASTTMVYHSKVFRSILNLN
jgi:hypothetical protein